VTERASSASRGCILAAVRPAQAPLCEIARWNSPSATGEPVSAAVMQAPADWPKIVTLFGSPPNAAMFCCTHLSAAIESDSAWLPEAWCGEASVSPG
jgi:hypothetical protein